MRQLLIVGMLLHLCTSVEAQGKKPAYSFFDSNWNKAANPNKAIYFTRLEHVDDSSWRLDKYQVYGPMLVSETFTDKQQTVRNGRYASYHGSGFIDSTGNFYNNKPHGDWYYFSDLGNYLFQKTYDNGVVISSYEFATGDAALKKDGTPSGIPVYAKQSEFQGGNPEWTKYLLRNLRYPSVALDSRIMGTVVVSFTVDPSGKAKEPMLFKSVQTLLDAEAVRLIADSPKWSPAEVDGIKVKSSKRQGIVFRTQ